ncbi:MAG TPA: class I SAM-dependent methyltransferase [Rhabdochlamydiaceae bacterium]|nr:class I SAM-dependent methyltransferase [Rhabdochlamydiaceae bacterium]
MLDTPSHFEQVVEIDKRGEAPWVKGQAFTWMIELDGWCSQEKAGVLIDLVLKVRPSVVVEVGVFGGKSLIPMAYALKVNEKGKIYGIDPWDTESSVEELINDENKHYWSIVDHDGILRKLLEKIDQFELSQQTVLIKATSEEAPLIPNIDILHIDGNHSEKTSTFDVTKWVPSVRKGGFIIFDDIKWHENGINTTGKAVEWLNENCIKIAEFNDSCTWGIWIKP